MVAALPCAALVATPLGDPPGRPFSIRDSIELSYIVNPTTWDVNEERAAVPMVSPDGRSALVITQQGMLETNSIQATLWIFDRHAVLAYVTDRSMTKPAPMRVATLSASSNLPVIADVRWLDDSRHIAFLGRQEHAFPQLFVVDATTGSLTQVTQGDAYVTAYDIRGDVTVYTTLSPSVDVPKVTEGLADVAGAGGIWHLLYPDPVDLHELDDTQIMSRANVLHVMRHGVELPMVFARDGAPLKLYVPTLALAPDGKSLITVAPVHRIPSSWAAYTSADQYIASHVQPGDKSDDDANNYWKILQYVTVDLQTGHVAPLVDAPAGGLGMFYFFYAPTSARWSADGAQAILSNTFLPLTDVSQVERTRRADAPATAVVDVATRDVHPIAYIHRQKRRTRYLGAIAWNESRQEVSLSYLLYPDNVALPGHDIYRLEHGEWRKEVPAVRDSSSLAENDIDLFVDQNLNQAPVLAGWRVGRADTLTVWDPNPQLAQVSIGKASLYAWKDKQGRPWDGILVLPPNYDQRVRYPLVIQTHGYQAKKFFADGIYTTGSGGRALAANGIVVLQMNEPPDYMDTPQEGPYQIDGIESAIQGLAKDGVIDPKRVGAIGFSYTCFHVLYTLTHRPDLFAAAAITDGNNKSYLVYIFAVDIGGDENPFLKPDEQTYGSRPYGGGLVKWASEAPGFNLDKVRAPLLISALERGALMGSWEIYAGLRAWQKPVDMMWVPSQRTVPHVLVKPQDRYMSQQSAVDWFRFWLQNYEDPDPAKTEQYARWRHLRELQRPGKVHRAVH